MTAQTIARSALPTVTRWVVKRGADYYMGRGPRWHSKRVHAVHFVTPAGARCCARRVGGRVVRVVRRLHVSVPEMRRAA
jgi:hypothetical protein